MSAGQVAPAQSIGCLGGRKSPSQKKTTVSNTIFRGLRINAPQVCTPDSSVWRSPLPAHVAEAGTQAPATIAPIALA